ncbi:MAG TPA: hypothetical protein VJC18_01365, partial [bacterium]|nr:hypothetical protein [bacterium]
RGHDSSGRDREDSHVYKERVAKRVVTWFHTVMRSHRLPLIIFISVLLLLLLSLWPAQAFAETFVKKQFNTLEQEVRSQGTLQEIAKTLSELNHFYEWPKEMSQQLRLYTGIVWFNQNHLTEATTVILATQPDEKYHDLWVYYQAMICLVADHVAKAKPHIEELEKKHGRDVDFLLLKSIYMAQSDNVIGAISIMDNVIRKQKQNGDAYLQRGFFHMMALSHDLAIRDFAKAAKYQPATEIVKKQQALFQNGLLYIRYKFNEAKGMELIKEGVALDPSSEMVKQMKEALRF